MLATFLFFGLAFSQQAAMPVRNRPMTQMLNGLHSSVTTSGFRVAHNKAELQKIIAESFQTGGAPTVSDVPKGKQMVFIFVGTRPTTGYSFEVQGQTLQKSSVALKVIESGPPPGTMQAQMITNPYVVVTIPSTSKVAGVSYSKKAQS